MLPFIINKIKNSVGRIRIGICHVGKLEPRIEACTMFKSREIILIHAA